MAENKYLEFLDPVTSPGINASRAPFFRPGRYSGFDKWDPFPAAGGLGIKVYHDNSEAVKITIGSDSYSHGVLVTPHGMVHLSFMEEGASDSDIELNLHHGEASEKIYMFYAEYDWANVEGGSAISYGIRDITSHGNSLSYVGGQVYSEQGDMGWTIMGNHILNQSPLGVFKVASGAAGDYDRIEYFPRVPWEHIFIMGSTGDWEFYQNQIRERDPNDRFIELYSLGVSKGVRIGVNGSDTFEGFSLLKSPTGVFLNFYGDHFLVPVSYNPIHSNSLVDKKYVDNLASFSAWMPLTLKPNWTTVITPEGLFEPLRFRVSSQHIEIHGYLGALFGAGAVAFNIPSPYRPTRSSTAYVRHWVTPYDLESLERVNIFGEGAVSPNTHGDVSFFDITPGRGFILNLLIPRT